MQSSYQNVLQDIWETWLRLTTQPSLATFEQEKVRTSIERGIISMVIAGLIAGVAAAIQGIVLYSIFRSIYAQGPFGGMVSGGVGSLANIITQPISAVIGLFIGSGILWLIAYVLQARGDYMTQTYLIAMYESPLYAASAVVGIIPCIGTLISFVIGLYSLYPLTLALRATHNIPTGKAVLIWAIPLAIVVVFGLCIAIVAGAAFFALLGAGR